MTNFNGEVGEGFYADSPIIPPVVGEIPWEGYTVFGQNQIAEAYQY
jgi:hypothetical protein